MPRECGADKCSALFQKADASGPHHVDRHQRARWPSCVDGLKSPRTTRDEKISHRTTHPSSGANRLELTDLRASPRSSPFALQGWCRPRPLVRPGTKHHAILDGQWRCQDWSIVPRMQRRPPFRRYRECTAEPTRLTSNQKLSPREGHTLRRTLISRLRRGRLVSLRKTPVAAFSCLSKG
jgi:hypothetical protein